MIWELGDSDNDETTQYSNDPEVEFFLLAEKVWKDCGKGGTHRLNATRGSARLVRYFGSQKALDDFEEVIFRIRKTQGAK